MATCRNVPWAGNGHVSPRATTRSAGAVRRKPSPVQRDKGMRESAGDSRPCWRGRQAEAAAAGGAADWSRRTCEHFELASDNRGHRTPGDRRAGTLPNSTASVVGRSLGAEGLAIGPLGQELSMRLRRMKTVTPCNVEFDSELKEIRS